MSKNIFKKVSYTEVNYSDLGRFITDKLAGARAEEFSIPESEECSNDISLRFSVKAEEPDDYYMPRIQRWLDGGPIPMYATRVFLCWLCARGDLEAGDYLVRVSW